MASLSAKAFQIHDENDYTLPSSTKSQLGKRGLGGKQIPSLAPSKGLGLKGSSEISQPAKVQRKALGSLSISNLNARNSMSSSVGEKPHKAAEMKKVPIVTITRNGQENNEANDMSDFTCSAPLMRERDAFEIIEETKMQILATGRFPSEDDALLPDSMLDRDPRPTVPEFNWDTCDFGTMEHDELFISATIDAYDEYAI